MCVVMAFAIDSVVLACHIYKNVWSAEIDSELPSSPEYGNCEDWYAITHAHSDTQKSSHDATNFCRVN